MFLVKSHVPSPTVWVSDEYELDPGGERVSAGAMAAMRGVVARTGRRSSEKQSRRRSRCQVVCGRVAVAGMRRSGRRWTTEWRGSRCSGCRCLIGVLPYYSCSLTVSDTLIVFCARDVVVGPT